MDVARATFSIDPVTLRERLDDTGAAEDRVRDLEARGSDGDAERVAWLRMLGRLDEAEALGWTVLLRAGGPGDAYALDDGLRLHRSAFAAALRLGHVLQWKRRFAEAEILMRAALHAAGDDERDLAYCQQHLGKLLYDQSRCEEALACFEEALRLRRAAGAPQEQIDSSLLAVGAARS